MSSTCENTQMLNFYQWLQEITHQFQKHGCGLAIALQLPCIAWLQSRECQFNINKPLEIYKQVRQGTQAPLSFTYSAIESQSVHRARPVNPKSSHVASDSTSPWTP